MVLKIISTVLPNVLYLRRAIQGVNTALDMKEILDASTLIETVKAISIGFLSKCIPPTIFFSRKYFMFIKESIGFVTIGGNLLIVIETLRAGKSIIKDTLVIMTSLN